MKRVLFVLLLLSWTHCANAIDLPPFEGLVEPWEIVDYSSQVDGILQDVKVERGDWVKRGQVLATLKSGVEKAAVDVARARVQFANRKMVRNKQLYQKKLISIHDKDELETEIQLARLQLVEAKEVLALRTIRSTIDGVVISRLGAPGEFVGEESFLTVAQINPLSLELVIPDIYMGAIKKGITAEVSLQIPETITVTATVVIVDEVLDAASGTFGVRLELDNPELKLPAGVKCQVIFNVQ